MKTLVCLLFLLLSSVVNSANAQNNFRIYLWSGDTLQLYRDIVDEIGINVIDLQNPCKAPKIIYASGTNMKVARYKDRPGVFSVLPIKDICSLTVYVEYNKELYNAGTTVFKTRPIPNANDPSYEDFRIYVPVIKRTLTDESFNIQGKTLKTGRFEASLQGNIFINTLFSGKENLVSVSIIDTVKECIVGPEIILESDDAKINKISRRVFSATPNEGVKRCHMKIYAMINNKKTFLKMEVLSVRR